VCACQLTRDCNFQFNNKQTKLSFFCQCVITLLSLVSFFLHICKCSFFLFDASSKTEKKRRRIFLHIIVNVILYTRQYINIVWSKRKKKSIGYTIILFIAHIFLVDISKKISEANFNRIRNIHWMNTSTYIRKKNYTYVNNKCLIIFIGSCQLDSMSMSTDPISFRLELEKKKMTVRRRVKSSMHAYICMDWIDLFISMHRWTKEEKK